ncbi:hypothetical protein CHELA1G11_12355 [Hyphomicrobiales bacterium]|nr:hypothetical protein CHELA1G2_11955 [Hyphomicrobiales bacterium]CAH1664266.1 hypothetical protein CHELA1G11_12355 [Hyphomicrobiales bacterium]
MVDYSPVDGDVIRLLLHDPDGPVIDVLKRHAAHIALPLARRERQQEEAPDLPSGLSRMRSITSYGMAGGQRQP